MRDGGEETGVYGHDLIIQRSNIKHFNLQVTFASVPNLMCKAQENIRHDQVHSGGPSHTPSKRHFQYSKTTQSMIKDDLRKHT